MRLKVKHKSRYPGPPAKGGRREVSTERARGTGRQGSGIMVPAGVQLFPESLFYHDDGQNYITWRAGNEDANIFFPYIKMDALEA